MTTINSDYKVIRSAIPKEYINLVIQKIKENDFVEAHPFQKFEGIKIDYSIIDPDKILQGVVSDSEKYFKDHYVPSNRDLILSRSYGTIMHPGAMLEPHKDLYNSGREHDFSYGDALVCNIYLSSCDGGELCFNDIDVELKLNAGDVVLFPGYLLTHSVNKINDGERITILNHFSLLSEEDTKNIENIRHKLIK